MQGAKRNRLLLSLLLFPLLRQNYARDTVIRRFLECARDETAGVRFYSLLVTHIIL